MKILIVDDEPAISDTLAYTLRADGFAVDSCTLGGAALQRLGAGGIDFVVLDVGLPDMSGFDVCRALRRTSDIPVLFLTARSDEVDRIVGLELGGDDYVAKPFSPREVASRIRAILRRLHPEPRLPSAPAAETARFAIDRAGLRIAYCGQWLNLTRYEYLLLALLLERPGRILSRPQIMESVWQDGGESLERTVDTHIKTLRGKLRAVRDEEVVLTHRGLGYSIAAG
ncbi:two-component system response regulator CreB [Dechloromonas sp. XY25]|uniref:Two-component system response regulator CreB n=1 Tax=Dechloromonas hankyongensis TaxID=2908002 RepID=A0ABS9K754_9RHOO|nr:two-component system response regulator CreB [Dechloromonas hankyongensis]MCG2578997.1 two-component system response regulator CreB [Dechloromonas hankyongensis]